MTEHTDYPKKWSLKDDNGAETPYESRSKAEEQKRKLESMDAEVELVPPRAKTDGVESSEPSPETQTAADVVEATNQPEPAQEHPTPSESDLPDNAPVDTNPTDWLPDHFVDTIQGKPVVNRKGYAVIASKYGVSVRSEPVTLPSETDFEYAEFKAVATAENGEEYTGFGSAHIDRQDGDDPYLLGELAETRAMKRATAWATGVGLTAASELMNEL